MNDLALHFLAKLKIMVVKDIEREDIEFICKGIGCKPIASLDHFTADMLGSAELVEEMHAGSSKIVKVRMTCTLLLYEFLFFAHSSFPLFHTRDAHDTCMVAHWLNIQHLSDYSSQLCVPHFPCMNECYCCCQVTGVQNPGRVVSVIVRGSNKLVLEEAERSIHDALCVIRCLVKKRFVIIELMLYNTLLNII